MSNKTKERKPRRKWLRRLIRWLILLAVLALAGLYGYHALKQEYTITYDSYTTTRGSISNALSLSGNLALIDSASYTANSDATVRRVNVAAGDAVKDGDTLVRLSNGQTVKAEFDGTVNVLDVKAGDEVKAGDSLIQVADMTHLKTSLRVSEYDIADVTVGARCVVTTTATEQTFESQIAAIDYISASGGSVAYYTATVYVDVDGSVYPGMQVTVTIPKEEAEDVVVLNMNALSFDARNSAFVYRKDDAGNLIEVPVEVGVSNGSYVEIRSGLDEGDVVFVESKEEESSNPFASLFGSQRFNQNRGGMPGGERPQGDWSGERGSRSGTDGSRGSGQNGGGQR